MAHLVLLLFYLTVLPATQAAMRSMAEILHNLAEHVYRKDGEMAYTIQRVLKEGKKYEYKKYDYKRRPLEKPHDVLDKMKNDAEMKKKKAQAKVGHDEPKLKSFSVH